MNQIHQHRLLRLQCRLCRRVATRGLCEEYGIELAYPRYRRLFVKVLKVGTCAHVWLVGGADWRGAQNTVCSVWVGWGGDRRSAAREQSLLVCTRGTGANRMPFQKLSQTSHAAGVGRRLVEGVALVVHARRWALGALSSRKRAPGVTITIDAGKSASECIWSDSARRTSSSARRRGSSARRRGSACFSIVRHLPPCCNAAGAAAVRFL